MLTPQQRWMSKEENREKHKLSVARCRARPAAKKKHRERQRLYAAQHREQERIRVAKWRAENPQKEKATKRRIYLRNKDVIIAKARAYRNANRELYRMYQRSYQAKRRAGGGKLSRGRIKILFAEQDGKCNACHGSLVKLGQHLDHIVAISKGGLHCDTNVQLLCPTCNRRKAAKNFAEFLKQLGEENDLS